MKLRESANKHLRFLYFELYLKMDSKTNSPIPDWMVAHSARYILEDLNSVEGMVKLANLTGLPMGVIVAAFRNFFPENETEGVETIEDKFPQSRKPFKF